MMKFPESFKVAIAGRPNVGKSSVFNRMIGEPLSIVDAVPGVTRDRIYGKVIKGDKLFEVIDTGGIFENASSEMEISLLDQVEKALIESDLILMILDAQTGIHPMDKEILKRLKLTGKPLFFAVNKVDNTSFEYSAYEFLKLGIDKYFPVSALHSSGFHELEKAILSHVPKSEPLVTEGFKIAVVGKPNVGKSSLINKILNSERSIVNNKPGTTRDAVFIDFYYENQLFTFIDTAGMMRRNRVQDKISAGSLSKAKNAIARANLAVLLLDASLTIEQQDMRIAREISDKGRCCLVVVNKWDLVKGVQQEAFRKHIQEKMSWLGFAPVLFVSVLKGRNHEKVMEAVKNLRERSFKKIPTGFVNQFFKNSLERTPPPLVGGKRFQIYYATQSSIDPPTFILFINHPKSVTHSYLNYLRHQLRIAFGFEGMPIRFRLREKKPSFRK